MGKIEKFTLPIEPLHQSPRKVWVYLPDSYATSKKKYPVLYMFDGHNLFYNKTATYGKCWGIKKYLDKQALDIVIIGQDCNHIGDERLDEYCPFKFNPVARLRVSGLSKNSYHTVKSIIAFTQTVNM